MCCGSYVGCRAKVRNGGAVRALVGGERCAARVKVVGTNVGSLIGNR